MGEEFMLLEMLLAGECKLVHTDHQKIVIKLERWLLTMLLKLQKFKELQKQAMLKKLPLIMLMPPVNQLNIQLTPNKKLTMLEEEEFMLLEMLLAGECKLVPKTLLTQLVMRNTLPPSSNQISSIKATTNQMSNGE